MKKGMLTRIKLFLYEMYSILLVGFITSLFVSIVYIITIEEPLELDLKSYFLVVFGCVILLFSMKKLLLILEKKTK